jgi:hypothetical protein
MTAEPTQQWFTVRELAARLHLAPFTTRQLVKPFREYCHLARQGSHPRRVLWIPLDVVLAIERQRAAHVDTVQRGRGSHSRPCRPIT